MYTIKFIVINNTMDIYFKIIVIPLIYNLIIMVCKLMGLHVHFIKICLMLGSSRTLAIISVITKFD